MKDKKIFRHLITFLICISMVIPINTIAFAQEARTNTPILGKPSTTVHQMKLWAKNRNANQLFIDLAPLYYSVSVSRGVDPAVTYTQSAKETNFLRFGGVLDASYFNPCGLKTTKGGGDKDPEAHTRFSSWEEGITAQVDHLALYAGAAGYPRANTPDPRHFGSIHGKAPMVEDLGANWAPSKDYGLEVVDMMNVLHTFPYSTVKRLSGNTRFDTSAIINQYAKVDSNIAVISNGHSFPDSITASILAGNLNAHLLLNDPGRVTGEIKNLMLTKKISTIYLVGGKTLPKDYIDSLKSSGISIHYVKGKSRYDTAVEVARQNSQSDVIFLANGVNFPDALSIAPIAKMKNANLLLTNGKVLEPAVVDLISSAKEVYIVGGDSSISVGIEQFISKRVKNVTRLSGKSRYETAAKLANNYYSNPDYIMLASGEDYADALSGTTLANALGGPILLTRKDELPNDFVSYIKYKKVNTLYILGGTGSIGKYVENRTKLFLDM
ncbi:cell wall-binding repeat-containing protein [Lagierella sp.]|uniref:cell wall-binding repeat-containing protein n=1 Tax=Lagierella sp. TaxID=2849657 RepID=UPI0026249987|nr:cell wall-binding repeat-containing protein [Lagierella sp.]